MFDPKTFLKLHKNKHIAFVGDSIARNQLESLLCMVSTASIGPTLIYTVEDSKFRKWHLPSHNINILTYWSPFLVKGIEKNSKNNVYILYLDSEDDKWAADMGHFGILVFSIGHCFLHPMGNGTSLGNCSKIRPHKEIEKKLEGMDAKMKAKEFGNLRIEALYVTKLALLRPDGNPGPYTDGISD
ncbi:Protein ALTERED XYLOGLUCAN 4 [Abeliophyllum distichum]|uniref:Protein ALTERED XYLOGLUCAN 4 n=1 Tax=Abeliophyllum distichum TaxID=126358 RepID=A0ABD1NTB0_9LAMI